MAIFPYPEVDYIFEYCVNHNSGRLLYPHQWDRIAKKFYLTGDKLREMFEQECVDVMGISAEGGCPKCGHPKVLRKNRHGFYFIGCSTFPHCDFSSSNIHPYYKGDCGNKKILQPSQIKTKERKRFLKREKVSIANAMQFIQQEVSSYYGISIKTLCSQSTNKKTLLARYAAVYMCKELTEFSDNDIAVAFNCRSTNYIANSCTRVKKLKITDVVEEGNIQALKYEIKEELARIKQGDVKNE